MKERRGRPLTARTVGWRRVLIVTVVPVSAVLVVLWSLILIGAWVPFLVGSDDSDLRLSSPRTASPAQKSRYGVEDVRVLAELTPRDRLVEEATEWYSLRFAFEPHRLVVQCRGEFLTVQEGVSYRRFLRAQGQQASTSIECGASEVLELPKAERGKMVRLDLIDTKFVEPDWGVLVVAR